MQINVCLKAITCACISGLNVRTVEIVQHVLKEKIQNHSFVPTCQVDRNPQAEQSDSHVSYSSAIQKEPVCSVENKCHMFNVRYVHTLTLLL